MRIIVVILILLTCKMAFSQDCKPKEKKLTYDLPIRVKDQKKFGTLIICESKKTSSAKIKITPPLKGSLSDFKREKDNVSFQITVESNGLVHKSHYKGVLEDNGQYLRAYAKPKANKLIGPFVLPLIKEKNK
jgi:hypothetical protein